MKSIIMPVTEKMDEKSTKQNSESISKEKKSTDEKSRFTAVDMWNRNRTSRSASDRIRKWNLN